MLSPLLGMMAAIIPISILGTILIVFAATIGIIVSIFSELQWNAFIPNSELIKSISYWAVAVCGTIGGFIWASYAIKEKWDRYKSTGKNWTEE